MAALLLLPTFPPAKSGRFLRDSQHLLHSRRAIAPRFPSSSSSPRSRHDQGRLGIHALQETKEEAEIARSSPSSSPAEITEKYGLEFGLWKIFSSKGEEGVDEEGKKGKSKTDQAKELLTKYGGAYLATSITLSLISFSLCYLLVSAGIDVQALLNKVGVTTNEAGGKVGTFALAYAAHKAASPIRFPPTVALTPIVASWIGKKTAKTDK